MHVICYLISPSPPAPPATSSTRLLHARTPCACFSWRSWNSASPACWHTYHRGDSLFPMPCPPSPSPVPAAHPKLAAVALFVVLSLLETGPSDHTSFIGLLPRTSITGLRSWKSETLGGLPRPRDQYHQATLLPLVTCR
jgi:hypothetical protein